MTDIGPPSGHTCTLVFASRLRSVQNYGSAQSSTPEELLRWKQLSASYSMCAMLEWLWTMLESPPLRLPRFQVAEGTRQYVTLWLQRFRQSTDPAIDAGQHPSQHKSYDNWDHVRTC